MIIAVYHLGDATPRNPASTREPEVLRTWSATVRQGSGKLNIKCHYRRRNAAHKRLSVAINLCYLNGIAKCCLSIASTAIVDAILLSALTSFPVKFSFERKCNSFYTLFISTHL